MKTTANLPQRSIDAVQSPSGQGNLIGPSRELIDARSKPIRAHEYESREIFSKDHFCLEFSELTEGMSLEDCCNAIIQSLDDLNRELNGRITDLVEQVKDLLSPMSLSPSESIEATSILASSYIKDRFSMAELEELDREMVLRSPGLVPINNLVYAYLGNGSLTTSAPESLAVNLHRAVSIPMPEKLRLLNEGFQDIARQLDENPRFEEVTRLTMSSWILERHPRLATRYGFTIVGPGKAEMTRENFLARHSRSDKIQVEK